MLTLNDFLTYAIKEIPSNEIPSFILYAIRVYTGTVLSGSEIMCRAFALYPEAQNWAQNCYLTTSAWEESFRTIETNCSSSAGNMIEICNCILLELVPIISQSNVICEKIPSIHLSEEADNKVFDVLKLGLVHLANVSLELKQQDLSWLKEFMSQEISNR